MLKLKLQHSGHMMWTANLIYKTPTLGKIEERRRMGWQRWDGWITSPTRWTWVGANSRRRLRTGKAGMLQSMGSQSQTRLSDWITTKGLECTELPPHLNLIDWPSPTASLEQSLRVIWRPVSWDAVLILPQIKLNSQLVLFFLVNSMNLTSPQAMDSMVHTLPDPQFIC